jgi:hypothetical protein
MGILFWSTWPYRAGSERNVIFLATEMRDLHTDQHDTQHEKDYVQE